MSPAPAALGVPSHADSSSFRHFKHFKHPYRHPPGPSDSTSAGRPHAQKGTP